MQEKLRNQSILITSCIFAAISPFISPGYIYIPLIAFLPPVGILLDRLFYKERKVLKKITQENKEQLMEHVQQKRSQLERKEQENPSKEGDLTCEKLNTIEKAIQILENNPEKVPEEISIRPLSNFSHFLFKTNKRISEYGADKALAEIYDEIAEIGLAEEEN